MRLSVLLMPEILIKHCTYNTEIQRKHYPRVKELSFTLYYFKNIIAAMVFYTFLHRVRDMEGFKHRHGVASYLNLVKQMIM